MKTLETEIIQAIQTAGGAVSCARFMELALYTPGLGYYERPEHTPGKRGDFYTNVSVGPVYGRLLAARFASWLETLNQPSPAHSRYCLVEAGGQDGRLAADILSALQGLYPPLFDLVEYWLIEPSATRRQWQQKTLTPFAGKVVWAAGLQGLPPGLRGIIFSNELLDAFPSHRLGWDARQNRWFEWGVGHQCGRFVWKRLDTDLDAGLEKHLPDLPQNLLEVLPDGFITELCPAASQWWAAAAARLGRGWLLTADYGWEEQDFFIPARAGGTLRAYYQHQQVKEILAQPGEQDLTCHVNFTALRQAGEAAGLITEGFFAQSEFLLAVATELDRAPMASWQWTSAFRRQLQTLTHPEHLGHRFRILVQRRFNNDP